MAEKDVEIILAYISSNKITYYIFNNITAIYKEMNMVWQIQAEEIKDYLCHQTNHADKLQMSRALFPFFPDTSL